MPCVLTRHARNESIAVRSNFCGLGARLVHERASGGARGPGRRVRRAGIACRGPRCRPAFPIVMPGLVPGIHVLWHRGARRERARRGRDVDARNKSGHDGMRAVAGAPHRPAPSSIAPSSPPVTPALSRGPGSSRTAVGGRPGQGGTGAPRIGVRGRPGPRNKSGVTAGGAEMVSSVGAEPVPKLNRTSVERVRP